MDSLEEKVAALFLEAFFLEVLIYKPFIYLILLMHPYRDNPIQSPKILTRVKFPLEEILDITIGEYCTRIGIDIDYYAFFSIVYSCDYRDSIDVPKGTEAVVNHQILQGKYSMYCVCVAIIPKSLFIY